MEEDDLVDDDSELESSADEEAEELLDQSYSPVGIARTFTSTNQAAVLGTPSKLSPAEQESKVELLARRLASVTGLPHAKCLETVSKLPRDEL